MRFREKSSVFSSTIFGLFSGWTNRLTTYVNNTRSDRRIRLGPDFARPIRNGRPNLSGWSSRAHDDWAADPTLSRVTIRYRTRRPSKPVILSPCHNPIGRRAFGSCWLRPGQVGSLPPSPPVVVVVAPFVPFVRQRGVFFYFPLTRPENARKMETGTGLEPELLGSPATHR